MKHFSAPQITEAGSLQQLTLGSAVKNPTFDFTFNGGSQVPFDGSGNPLIFTS